jgi:hypothetical protein
MFTLTHTSKNNQGDVENVYRNRETRIAVIHRSAYRGGCLYLGTVTVLNQDTGDGYTFTSTARPGEISELGAAAYAAKHGSKVGA